MKILAIETSCDDASVVVVEAETNPPKSPFSKGGESKTSLFNKEGWGEIFSNPIHILAEKTASQIDVHAKYGGVFPEMAAREHFATLLPTIEETLHAFKPNQDPRETLINDIDLIAVTVGPGLIGSLLIGVTVAQTLALATEKKLIPVNHMAGHIYSCFLEDAVVKSKEQGVRGDLSTPNSLLLTPHFPVLALIVSGGHTQLVWMEDHGRFKVIGSTLDDAAGEAFDKVSVMLGLGYPGGPSIQSAATDWITSDKRQETRDKYKKQIVTCHLSPVTCHFPRPMINEGLDFSFSGLKTAVRYWLDRVKSEELRVRSEANTPSSLLLAPSLISLASYELQEAITDVLVTKLFRAVEIYKPKSIIVAGGVSANQRLREKMTNAITQLFNHSISLHFPPLKHSTDNAAMIGAAALAMLNAGIEPVNPEYVEAKSNWPLEDWK